MKKLFYLLIVTTFAIGIQSCDDKIEDVAEYNITIDKSLNLDLLKAISPEGDAIELIFEASHDWKIEVSNTWLSVELPSGKKGKITTTINITENPTSEERKATITISSGTTLKKTLEVTQLQKIEEKITFEVIDNEFLNAIPSEGGSTEVKFTASHDWEIIVNDTKTSEWLSVEPLFGGAGEATVIITAIENTTTDTRNATITISIGTTLEKPIEVTQLQKLITVWDSPSKHFANLKGKVASIDKLYTWSNIAFNENGYIESFNDDVSTEQGQIVISVKYTYNESNQLSLIECPNSADLTFTYGNHGKYVEVHQDFFVGAKLSAMYIFQPMLIKNLTGITVKMHGQGTFEYKFNVERNVLTVIDPNEKEWSKTVYSGIFPSVRTYNADVTLDTESGGKVNCTAFYEDIYTFNPENGNILSLTLNVDYKSSDGTLLLEESSSKTYYDDAMNQVKVSGKENYVYDEFGDRLSITGGYFDSTYTYVRDAENNWTTATERVVQNGEYWDTYSDTRIITYH